MKLLLLILFLYPIIRAGETLPITIKPLLDNCWPGFPLATIGDNKHCNISVCGTSCQNDYTSCLVSVEMKNIGINESIQVSWGNTSISNEGSPTFSIQQFIPHACAATIIINTGSLSQMEGIIYFYTDNPRLRKLVEDYMVHSPCEGDPTAYCRADLDSSKIQCRKGFPKCYNDVTKAGDRYYPELVRPNDGEHCSKNKKADNKYIVPYNTQLLTFWEGHMNVEVISALSIVKYIFKYLFKGFDRALVEIASGADSLDKDAMTIDGHLVLPKNIDIPEGKLKQRRKDAEKLLRKRGIPLKDENGRPTVVYNEFWIVEDMRAVTSCEAAWELAGYERHSASHIVINNSIHAEHEERLVYAAEDQDEMLKKIEKEDFKTKLKAWFKLNEMDPDAHDYTFSDLPLAYIFEKGEWRPRKRKINNLVTRIKGINPRYKELFAIRLLCINLKGIKSFEQLRTVNGTVYATAVEAAKAFGFMNDKMEWDLCLAEASNYDNPKALRRLFCQIITNNPVTTAYTRELYEKYKVYFYVNKRWDEKHLEAHCLYHIQSFLAANGGTLEEHGLPSLQKEDLLAEDLVDDSGRHLYAERLSKREASNLKKTMTSEQRAAFDTIVSGIHTGEQTAFFLQGSGGTGKTRIMKALFHEFRAQKKKVACVAQTGIAASLLPIGSTAHRRFQIPLSPEENMHSTADLESDEAEYLKQLDLIIWDEATMADRRILQCVHKLLSTLRYGESNKIFGGCPCVFAGDWKQTLPVVPEAPGEAVVNFTAIEWLWWKDVQILHLLTNMRAKDDPKFAEFCAKVGSGEANIHQERRTVDQLTRLPINRLVGSTKEVISKIYGAEGPPEEKREIFRKSAILAVDNETVFDLNDKILGLLDTVEYSFKSVDEFDPKNGFEALDPETYYLATPSGYPRHQLKVKVGAVVMLLINMNVFRGLTNGTRLIVEEIGVHIIRCTPLNPEKHMPKDILLHRVLFTPAGVLSREISFTRMQFPIRLAFSMTCNKAQGQTLHRCGLVLSTPCFAHGQLYVALSRVRKEEDLYIYNAAKKPSLTNNVVYRKVFGYEEKSANGQVQTISSDRIPAENNNVCTDTMDSGQNEAYNEGYASEGEDFITVKNLTENRPDPVSTLAVEQGFSINKPNIIQSNGQSTTPLPIQNLGMTCYANSAIQLLGRLWKQKIVNYSEGNLIILALKEVLSGSGRRGASSLLEIEELPEEYRDFGQQQSSAELITTLMSLVPAELTEEVAHLHRPYYVCLSCGKESSGRPVSNTTWALGAADLHYDSFEEYVISYTRPKPMMKSCEDCQLRNPDNRELWYAVEHRERWDIEIPLACKYLPIEMNIFERIRERTVRRNRTIGNPPARLELFGHVWKPVAAIWHRGNTPNDGHYKAFVEEGGRWWECDDSVVKIAEFPTLMKGIVFVVLEKVNFEIDNEVEMEGDEMTDGRIEREIDRIQPHGKVLQVVSTVKTPVLIIEKNSIVDVSGDVIVNAANPQLQHGGGVDGIIRSACGPRLINEATEKIKRTLPNNELAPGQVVATDSFLLKKCKRVYHTAAPYIQSGNQPSRSQEEHLRLCYYNSLALAEKECHGSITFPILGIGLYHYDEKKGMAIALQAVFSYFESHPLTKLTTVRIVAVSGGIVKKMQALIGGEAEHSLETTLAAAARRKLEMSQDTDIPVAQVHASYGQEGLSFQGLLDAQGKNASPPRKFEITADSKVALISISSAHCGQCKDFVWIYDGTGENAQFIGTSPNARFAVNRLYEKYYRASDIYRNHYISQEKTVTLYYVYDSLNIDNNVYYMDVIANEAKNMEKCSSFDILSCPSSETSVNIVNYTIDATGGGAACLAIWQGCYVKYATQFGNLDSAYVYAGVPHPDPVQAGLILNNYRIPFDETNVGVPRTFQVAPYTYFEVIINDGSTPCQGSLVTWYIGSSPTEINPPQPTTKKPNSPKISGENGFVLITVISLFHFLI